MSIHDFLCTVEHFENFELRLEAKVIGQRNSGIVVRTVRQRYSYRFSDGCPVFRSNKDPTQPINKTAVNHWMTFGLSYRPTAVAWLPIAASASLNRIWATNQSGQATKSPLLGDGNPSLNIFFADSSERLAFFTSAT